MSLIICEPGYVPTGLNPDGTVKPCAAEGTPEAEAYWQLVAKSTSNTIPPAPEIELPEVLTMSVEQPAVVQELALTGTTDIIGLSLLGVAIIAAAGLVMLTRWLTTRRRGERS